MSLETEIREAFERHANDARPAPEVWAGVERRIARSHRRRVIASGLVGVAAVIGLAFAVPRLTSNPELLRPAPGETEPPSAPMLVGKVPVQASVLAAGADAIWAVVPAEAEGRADKLVRIDPATGRVGSENYLGFGEGIGNLNVRALAVEDTGIWALAQDGLTYVALPFRGENFGPTVIGVDDPRDVALGFGSAWVTSLDAGILRILRIPRSMPPSEAGLEATITSERKHAPDQEAYVAVGDGFVWVTVAHISGEGIANLYRIDPKTNRIDAELAVQGGSPWHIAFGSNGIWLTDTGETSPSALRRIDAARFPNQAAFITLPDAAPVGLRAITTGAGYIWATSSRGYLWKIDPRTNLFADPTLIGDAPPVSVDDVVFGSGSIWVAAGDGQVWRFSP